MEIIYIKSIKIIFLPSPTVNNANFLDCIFHRSVIQPSRWNQHMVLLVVWTSPSERTLYMDDASSSFWYLIRFYLQGVKTYGIRSKSNDYWPSDKSCFQSSSATLPSFPHCLCFWTWCLRMSTKFHKVQKSLQKWTV